MKVSTISEFRDKASGVHRSNEPVLITRRGRVAGVFLPSTDGTLPLDLKQELFDRLSRDISRRLAKRGVTEEAVLADFEAWRKVRRETRRRR